MVGWHWSVGVLNDRLYCTDFCYQRRASEEQCQKELRGYAIGVGSFKNYIP